MRLDKLTTEFQQALADAQSIAVGQANPYIEPIHLLLALLSPEDGGRRHQPKAADQYYSGFYLVHRLAAREYRRLWYRYSYIYSRSQPRL